MTADDIIAAARACLGTPFRHQGRIPGTALDCAGLAITVAQSLGVDTIDRQGYGTSPHNGQLKHTLDEQPGLMQVENDELAPGDLLLMRFGRDPQHLAIFTGQNIIHSYEAVGIACEHRLSEIWQRRIVAVYRFRGVA